MDRYFLIFTLLMLMVVKSWSQYEYTLPEVRDFYGHSIENSDSSEMFLDYMKNCPNDEGIYLAYEGSAQALISRHVWNPFKKMEWLKKAEKTFESAVSKDPKNAEIRFQRFCIQHYIPSFLGFSGNRDEDRAMIVKHLGETETLKEQSDLFVNICQFMIDSGRCTDEEIKILKELKAGREATDNVYLPHP